MRPLLALCILLLIPMGCLSQACRAVNTQLTIREDAKPDTVVTEIIIDPGYVVEVHNNPTFTINGNNLVLNGVLDYEKEQVINVVLLCKKDNQTASIETIYVTVGNVNDNQPLFNQNSYSFRIPENAQVGSSIGTVEAQDADEDTLYYELIGNDMDAATYFRLTSETYPRLLVNKPLDYDLHPHIWFNLTARDTERPGDVPSFTATTSIIIDITDTDDKPPFFQPCTPAGTKICINNGYRSSVTLSETATQPLQLFPGPLYAIDGDYGINDPISYSIISGNDNNIFAIDINTGNITMNKSVDRLGTILLQVMAFQTDNSVRYSTTTVQIEVKERNNHPPVFQKTHYYGTIPANTASRSFVLDSSDRTRQLQVFAADADFTDGFNAAITYRIENSTDFIVSRDGYILTNSVITSPGTIVFLVNATDGPTSDSNTTVVTVQITPALILPTTTRTTAQNTPSTDTTTTTTPSTGTTTTTTAGTGTTTTTTPSTGTTTTTTAGTGTTTTTTPSTGTTTTTTAGTGTTTTTTPSTGTTTTTTAGTGTSTTTTPSTGTTTSTNAGTGTTTTTTPFTGTTTSTTAGTGTTTTTTPFTGTTTSTTVGTGTTTTTTPFTGTTTSTTAGTGTTTTTTPFTGTTTSTTAGTGTITTTTPFTGTTTSTTAGTGTTTTTTPSTKTTTTTTVGTGTTTTTTPSTRTTTTTTAGTGTTTTTPPSTRTTKSTTTGTGTSTTKTPLTSRSTTTGITTTISIYHTTSGTGPTTSTTPGTGNATKSPDPGPEERQNQYYTATDMAAVGATLGAVLVLTLVGLAFLIYKQYGNAIQSRLRKGPGNNFGGSEGSGDSTEQLVNDDDNVDKKLSSNLESGIDGDIIEVSSENNLLTAAPVTGLSTNVPSEEADKEPDSEDKKVKSILTKDLKEDGGYKSVWFRQDAAPEVMVIEGAQIEEANDDDTEEEISNQQGDDDDDDDDDDDELDPTFNITNNNSNNFSIL